MVLLISISALVAAALLAVLILILKSAASAGGDLPLSPEWIDELSIERYRPMLRILDSGELEFLRTQPGFSNRMAARLRRQRYQVFSGYLKALRADFRRVCTAVKFLMLQSRRDRPDLAAVLVRQQALFALAMAMVQFRALCYRWGICGVDVGVLLKTFEAMRLELRGLTPAAGAAAA